MKKKIVIINYGSSNLDDLNPNSAAIIKLITYLQKKFNVHIITNNEKEIKEIELIKLEDCYIHVLPTVLKNKRKYIDIYSSNVIEHLTNVLNIQEVEACIAVSFPFYPSIKVMNFFKKNNPNIKNIIYEFDPLAFNGSSSNSFLQKNLKLLVEGVEFYKADSIWLTQELYNQYSNNVYRIFRRKFREIGIPLLDQKEIYENKKNSVVNCGSTINLVYSGTFYDEIRSPKYLIELFENVVELSESKINLHIYGSVLGEASKKILNDAEKLLSGNVYLHGKVDRKKINSILLNADILINVSNTVKNQLPSKVFEYIGTCKPIINLTSIQNDSSSNYLRDYPKNLTLIENPNKSLLRDQAKQIVEFCRKNTGKTTNPDSIVSLYESYMVKTIALNAENALEELIN